MATSEKETRYRWKDGKERELLAFVNRSTQKGSTVTAALKEYGEKHGISWLTARWKYYQMKRRLHAQNESVSKTKLVPDTESHDKAESALVDDDDFLTALSALIVSSQHIGEDVVSLIRGFSRMASLAHETIELKQQLNNTAKDMNEIRQTAQAARKSLEDLDEVIGSWQRLSSVEKFNTLREFEQSLEIQRLGIAKALDFLTFMG